MKDVLKSRLAQADSPGVAVSRYHPVSDQLDLV